MGKGASGRTAILAWLKDKTPMEVARDVLDRKQFNLGAHGANILAKPIVQKNATVILVTCQAVAAQLRGTYIVTVPSLREAWKTANLLVGSSSSVLFIEKARRLILC